MPLLPWRERGLGAFSALKHRKILMCLSRDPCIFRRAIRLCHKCRTGLRSKMVPEPLKVVASARGGGACAFELDVPAQGVAAATLPLL